MTRTRPAGLDLHLDAVPGSVPAARHAAARWAATEGAEGPDLYRICLAVSEAVTNAVVHAYSQRFDGMRDVPGADGATGATGAPRGDS
ncbi:MAG TPA: ATP-binding protein, partial [Solirubrobacteraceae bacterium]|nr:ATP-binding protein [Solirubrobacteraceae bacterium]